MFRDERVILLVWSLTNKSTGNNVKNWEEFYDYKSAESALSYYSKIYANEPSCYFVGKIIEGYKINEAYSSCS